MKLRARAWAAVFSAATALSIPAFASDPLLPLKGPLGPVAPGRVAVFSIEEPAPAGMVLAGFQQEAGFYHLASRGKWVALLAVPLNAKEGKERLTLHWPGAVKAQWSYLLVGPDPYPRRKQLSVPKLGKKLSASKAAREKDAVEEAEKLPRSKDPLWLGPFRWPLDGPIKITSPFGSARVYNSGVARWRHKGSDLRAREGTPIYAPNRGRVLFARRHLHATGGTVILDHGYGLSSRYFHLSRVNVKVGQDVEKGELLGQSGSTGLANGPHLHWEIQLRGEAVEPIQWVGTGREP